MEAQLAAFQQGARTRGRAIKLEPFGVIGSRPAPCAARVWSTAGRWRRPQSATALGPQLLALQGGEAVEQKSDGVR